MVTNRFIKLYVYIYSIIRLTIPQTRALTENLLHYKTLILEQKKVDS